MSNSRRTSQQNFITLYVSPPQGGDANDNYIYNNNNNNRNNKKNGSQSSFNSNISQTNKQHSHYPHHHHNSMSLSTGAVYEAKKDTLTILHEPYQRRLSAGPFLASGGSGGSGGFAATSSPRTSPRTFTKNSPKAPQNCIISSASCRKDSKPQHSHSHAPHPLPTTSQSFSGEPLHEFSVHTKPAATTTSTASPFRRVSGLFLEAAAQTRLTSGFRRDSATLPAHSSANLRLALQCHELTEHLKRLKSIHAELVGVYERVKRCDPIRRNVALHEAATRAINHVHLVEFIGQFSDESRESGSTGGGTLTGAMGAAGGGGASGGGTGSRRSSVGGSVTASSSGTTREMLRRREERLKDMSTDEVLKDNRTLENSIRDIRHCVQTLHDSIVTIEKVFDSTKTSNWFSRYRIRQHAIRRLCKNQTVQSIVNRNT